MKKMIYTFAVITALTVISTANAVVPGTDTYIRHCEVCPYASETLCNSWVPNCPDPDVQFDFNPDPFIDPPGFYDGDLIDPPASTATVSSCPAGTTKSSDGCCCVNN